MSQDVNPTIYGAARLCSELFEQILKSTDNGNPLFLFAEELRGRFSLWAAYVGVYAAPRASLDARLDGHKKIKDMVLELIEMVQRNLRWELSVESKSTSGTQSSLDPLDGETHDDPSIDVLGLDAAEAAIDRLLILAVAIRRSARRNRKLRRGTNDQQAELLCCLLVKTRYPNARNSLCNQLGASIYTRGTSLLYLKMHNKKLAFERHDRSSVQDAADEDAASENDDQGLDNCVDRATVDKQPRASAPETLPSALSPSVFSRITKTKNKPSGSIASRGWTVRDGQSDNFYYPPKPEVTNDKKYQSCNLCADPLEESNLTQEAWEAHVDQDLEPYVCISEECREPPRYFVRKRDWLDHMQTRHSMTWAEKIHTEQWYCDIGHDNPLEFDEKETFVAHLKNDHGNQLTKSKLEGRARRNRRIATREPFVCPLCGCVPDGLEPGIQENLSHHIATHLKSLAFLSLSYVDDDPGNEESVTEPFENDDEDDANISRISLRNRTLESFDDIPTTDVLENGMRSVGGQEFPGEPPLLNPPQTRNFELLRRQLQGLRSVVSDLSEPGEPSEEPEGLCDPMIESEEEGQIPKGNLPLPTSTEDEISEADAGSGVEPQDTDSDGDAAPSLRQVSGDTEANDGPSESAAHRGGPPPDAPLLDLAMAVEPLDGEVELKSQHIDWAFVTEAPGSFANFEDDAIIRSMLRRKLEKASDDADPPAQQETSDRSGVPSDASAGHPVSASTQRTASPSGSSRHKIHGSANSSISGTRQSLSPPVVPSAPEERLGRLLDGKLQLTDILGIGAYAVVYLAVDIKTRQQYAVKCLSKFNADGTQLEPRQVAYQQREIRLHWKASNHANVVQMLKIVDDPDCIYVILEYCPEGDLFLNITERGQYVGKDELSRNIFLQILDAVEHCHNLGIYHRDLKPENIWVTDSGDTVKLADFGLATADDRSEDYGCGSSSYMSPECLDPSARKPYYYCAPNDVWSLGVILVNLTCGRNPWKQASFQDSTYRAYAGSKDFLKTILPLSDELNDILGRIFEPIPERRITLPELRTKIMACSHFTTVSPITTVAPPTQALPHVRPE